jgi:hypothetical protein
MLRAMHHTTLVFCALKRQWSLCRRYFGIILNYLHIYIRNPPTSILATYLRYYLHSLQILECKVEASLCRKPCANNPSPRILSALRKFAESFFALCFAFVPLRTLAFGIRAKEKPKRMGSATHCWHSDCWVLSDCYQPCKCCQFPSPSSYE